MRYIDADKLIGDFLYKKYSVVESKIEFGEAINLVQEQPTADVYDIIHCKDCVYHETDIFNQKVCTRTFNQFAMPEYGFCSEGAKRELEESKILKDKEKNIDVVSRM